MNKKKYIIIGVVVVALVLSQVLLVQLVYAKKVGGNIASTISKIYSLKAGTIVKDEQILNISLDDFFINKRLAVKFLSTDIAVDTLGISSQDLPDDEEINNVVWEKLVREVWLNSIADEYDLGVNEEDVSLYLEQIGDLETLKQKAQEDFDLSFSEYQRLVITPFILEAKVYEYLLDNYNDTEGVQKAQLAYEALESGRDYLEVAEEFSNDVSFAENSIWLAEGNLVDFYEPIKELEIGDYSEIVMIPGAYIIWHLESITEDGIEKMWEATSIFIKAKNIDDFLAMYLTGAEIKRKY